MGVQPFELGLDLVPVDLPTEEKACFTVNADVLFNESPKALRVVIAVDEDGKTFASLVVKVLGQKSRKSSKVLLRGPPCTGYSDDHRRKDAVRELAKIMEQKANEFLLDVELSAVTSPPPSPPLSPPPAQAKRAEQAERAKEAETAKRVERAKQIEQAKQGKQAEKEEQIEEQSQRKEKEAKQARKVEATRYLPKKRSRVQFEESDEGDEEGGEEDEKMDETQSESEGEESHDSDIELGVLVSKTKARKAKHNGGKNGEAANTPSHAKKNRTR